jgi:hypothetical protein
MSEVLCRKYKVDWRALVRGYYSLQERNYAYKVMRDLKRKLADYDLEEVRDIVSKFKNSLEYCNMKKREAWLREKGRITDGEEKEKQ